MRDDRTTLRLLPLSLLLVLVAACAGNITPNRQIDDALLSTNVRDALAADQSLRGYDIVVNAQEGAVTLLGTVRTETEKQRAEAIAGRVDGVMRVINELRVN